MNREVCVYDNKVDMLFSRISQQIESARKEVAGKANAVLLQTNYMIGHYIVEEEQQGQERATYGTQLLKELSRRLTERYGKGWSKRTLDYCKQFYLMFSNSPNVSGELESTPQDCANVFAQLQNTSLTWSHYLILMRIDNALERRFYEIEASNETWSVRQLQRQVASSLYERLALSRDKKEVLRLSQEGQTIEKATDLIKNPFTLEFLGLKEETAYSERNLETAIINKLQEFLLEMGKGFLFEARQKRFTFQEDNFYVDLVLYNRLLQCYVLIDLKIDKLTHQDLGQMQMYVNYYDRHVKQEFEKPTIGILLCKDKDDALVCLTLPDNANIYASEYALYLPDKQLLQEKLNEWADEYEEYHLK